MAYLDDMPNLAPVERVRQQLQKEGVDPDDVIVSPENAPRRGLTSTVCFPNGNIAPEGAVIKSTAIDASVVDPDGVFRMTGPAKVFLSERAAMDAIKEKRIKAGDVLVLICRGPMGAGMEETYQITSALRHLPFETFQDDLRAVISKSARDKNASRRCEQGDSDIVPERFHAITGVTTDPQARS